MEKCQENRTSHHSFRVTSLKTPGKINLYLRVTGKRQDGYHEIETIFLPLKDIHDTILISPSTADKITISSSSLDIPLDENNLCYKAAKRYSGVSGITASWDIQIIKNIPVTAGMGGGSSDAAAVLLILQKICNKLSAKELYNIATELGADVPYFLNPVPSVGRGIGDILEPIPFKNSFAIVILAPQFPISAAWAYKHLEKNNSKYSIQDILKSMRSDSTKNIASMIYNDLSFTLYKKFPILEILKNDLLDAGTLNAEITGSGPTLFGICNSTDEAKNIMEKIKTKYKDTVLCKFSEILTGPNSICIDEEIVG